MISHASTYKRDKEERREKERAIDREIDYISGRSEMSCALESSLEFRVQGSGFRECALESCDTPFS